MKKLIALMLAAAMLLTLAACTGEPATSGTSEVTLTPVAKENLKIGFICLHDENSTYDLNFLKGVDELKTTLGLRDDQVVIKTNIPESAVCAETAMDLADMGCNIVFANSFGHESYMIEAAREYPNVQFCHATGTRAHTEGLSNYHNAFASIYEGRFLAGVAAGMKLNEMIANNEFTAEEAKIGYVGAYTYAEVVSGYTSFYLGAKSVCPTVTMQVQFTGEWYEETLEKEAANILLSNGCKLISQHADSMGAPTACEQAGVPNVSYNGSTVAACPNTFIVSSRINWAPYYKYISECVIAGEAIATDWTGTLESGSVELSAVNETAAAAGTAAALEEMKQKLIDGTVKVFDIETFKVGGEKKTAYKADVDTDEAYTPDTEVIKDGAFAESVYRSAPYFDLRIDGIELLNEKY